MDYINRPTTPERRIFSKLARQYVSAMYLYSNAIANANAVGDGRAQTAKLQANAQRSLAYKALLNAALRLAEVGGNRA